MIQPLKNIKMNQFKTFLQRINKKNYTLMFYPLWEMKFEKWMRKQMTILYKNSENGWNSLSIKGVVQKIKCFILMVLYWCLQRKNDIILS
jgi:predicted secreted protein